MYYICFVKYFTMFRWIKSRLTMKKVKRLFVDMHDLKAVNEYVDCYGDIFMAQSKFGLRINITDLRNGDNNVK